MVSTTENDLKQQEISQAVIVADNFNKKFSPLTNSKPLMLLPLVNGIVLDLILKSLEEDGIQETYIFCGLHNNQIRSYINSSQWCDKDGTMSVTVFSSSSFLSMGDIMRELDSKALIRSDFILIDGAVITTFSITEMLEKHRRCRKVDKNAAITLLYKKALPNHRTKCKEHGVVVAVESNTNRIRYYQRINKAKSVHIPLEVFIENEEVSIHYNLLDSYISICSPIVPPLFSDNFDYQTMDDLVKGLLVNEELLGNSMYIDTITSGYGANVSNLFMYDAVSQDIVSRWVHPIVPELIELKENLYTHSLQNIYKADGVETGHKSILHQNIVIGKGSKIGENCYIVNSVIGSNCIIGNNVRIKGSYLWDGVHVGNDCNLDTCLLAENVKLHDKVQISPGCVLGNEVVIGENITLPSYVRLQSEVSKDEDSFGEDSDEESNQPSENKTCDIKLVGEKGHGYLCWDKSESDQEDNDNDIVEDIWGEPIDQSTWENGSVSSSEAESEDELIEGYDDTYFYNEVLESLQRGIEEKVKSENIVLEINSSKHAYNISIKEMNTLLIKALLKLPFETAEPSTSQQYLASLKPSLQFFKPLIANYIKKDDSQFHCLSSMEEFMNTHEDIAPAVVKVMHFWYDQDILNEPVILEWYKDISPEHEKTKKLASTFVQWLLEADEESSDDEESSEDE
ncbi:translation initiation factor eIF-2B subunit epsilon [Caerostris darwini]|uniref:Translation initiation factor eIF2B subunit epsilon n=1 Tax=Caerostris darwini TaxID=1538125 RepID=A0AAV4Q2Y8_9ARAC|nr:translation initiation factor eIF-2B subunit epsilon [Caerostris darwini]